MTAKGSIAICAAALCLAAVGLAPSAFGQTAKLAMLDGLNKGEWTVRFRDGDASQKLCLKNGREFIQLRHPSLECNRFVVEDEASLVRIQYTCAGNGYGNTSIRRETPTLVQIESRGISDGHPFEFLAEARQTGICK